MTIIVADQPVQEYDGDDGKVFIEMDLQAKTSYDCEYKDDTPHGEEVSSWPVTPYTVQARNRSGSSHYWCELHFDGAFVKQELLNPGQTKTFTGFSDNGSTREFLFALPRYQRTTDGDEVVSGRRARAIGAIECRFLQATYSAPGAAVVGRLRRRRRLGRRGLPPGEQDRGAKIAKQRGQEDGGKDAMTGTTRAGRAVGGGGGGGKSSAPGYKTMNIWNKGSLDSECCVHYRQKHILKQMGVIRGRGGASRRGLRRPRRVGRSPCSARTGSRSCRARGCHARTYNLPEMPAVDGRTSTPLAYAPTSRWSAMKFNLGDVAAPDGRRRRRLRRSRRSRRGSAAGDGACSVIDDHQQLFSAASVALFGSSRTST